MWKDKGLQLVMLPTKEKSLLWSHKGRTLRYNEANFNDAEDEERYFLYILSDEEISEGNWCVNDNKDTLYQPNCLGDTSGWSKVIATTDPSLNLPQFTDSFLEEYVKRCNSKKSLEVGVLHINEGRWNWGNPDPISNVCVMDISNNTISIRFKEEKAITPKTKYTFGGERMYSRSEVEELCKTAFEAGEAYRTGSCEGFKQIHPNKYDWIKENLK